MSIELLAPAGDLSKLKIAILYGADAVYIGGEEFSLRSAAKNFSRSDIEEGIKFAHNNGKKVYITANIFPRNNDIEKIAEYAKWLYSVEADGVIVSDLGAFSIIKEAAPNLPIHVSTQANTINYQAAKVWHNMGASRVVLARELSFEEIKKIREELPEDCEIECFVHGSMCMSYSGRCVMSNYLASRDANRGECAQPCRWKYYLMEEKRPGEYIPVEEDEKGSYIFNSRDMCMIEHIPELIKAGIKSFKIEGRVKNENYVATVVKAYRKAIDLYYEGKSFDKNLLCELEKVSHREYSKGFYFDEPGQITAESTYIKKYNIMAVVRGYDEKTKTVTLEQRNRFCRGDVLEFMPPQGENFEITVDYMENGEGEQIDATPHPQMTIRMPLEKSVPNDTIVRKAL